jgi:hypothetical protein
MILLEKHGTRYRCNAAAFITSLQGDRQCDVCSRAEVVAFLTQHHDEHFFLMCDVQKATEVREDVDEAQAIFCGMVRWSSRHQVVENHRFNFAA